MTKNLLMQALFRAKSTRRPAKGLILHSDRRSQYCSHDYQKLTQQFSMVPSMSRKGDCWDTHHRTSFWGTLKNELVQHRRYRTRAQATQEITEYIGYSKTGNGNRHVSVICHRLFLQSNTMKNDSLLNPLDSLFDNRPHKGNVSVARFDSTAYLVAQDVWISFRIPPFESALAAGDETSKRHLTIPPPTVPALKHPCLGPTRFRHSDMIEDGAGQPAKQGCRVVSVLVEGCPAHKLPVQILYQVNPIPAVITRQMLYQFLGKAPIFLPWDRRYRSHAPAWPSLANDAVTKKHKAIVHMCNTGLLHIQCELQLAFKEFPASFTHCFHVRLGSLDTTTKSSA